MMGVVNVSLPSIAEETEKQTNTHRVEEGHISGSHTMCSSPTDT